MWKKYLKVVKRHAGLSTMNCKSHNENFADAPFGTQNKRFGCFCKEFVLFVFILMKQNRD